MTAQDHRFLLTESMSTLHYRSVVRRLNKHLVPS
jgi:hypothetical protein